MNAQQFFEHLEKDGWSVPGELPDRSRLKSIEQTITASLAPVKPLPGDRVLVSLTVILFWALSLIFAAVLGFNGWLLLPWSVRVPYFALLGVCSVLFAREIVHLVVPGSRRRMSTAVAILLLLLSLAGLTPVLFPDFSLTRFVARGIFCFVLGSTCALVTGALLALLARRSFVVDTLQTAAAMGAFAGLLGFAVLAFHCPFLSAPHILVWHVGAVAVGSLGGLMFGWLFERTKNSVR